MEYHPWKVSVDISDTPYEKTAGARMKKYEIDVNATKDGKLMENDIVLFRYADVLLMKSEAKVRNGESGDEEMAKVRSRVGAKLVLITLATLLDERQLSLLGRDGDAKTLYASGGLPCAYDSRPQLPEEANGYTTVFPIPGNAEDEWKIVQNKGY